jgi:A/G-specific adenine glycosylase
VSAVKELLLAWYRENRRPLPWRETTDPYAILVSEVMAQQNRVENVDQPVMQPFLIGQAAEGRPEK